MKLTKYEHACFTVEKDGKLLVVDPGIWTTDLGAPENVIAIVVTHEHPDHFDPNALGALIAHNPDAIIYGHEDIVKQLGDTLPNSTVSSGDSVIAGPFQLEFFGGSHATIHPSFPNVANLGVMINNTIYYPGDALSQPAKPVAVLALPVVAPWMKLSDAMDYVTEVKADIVFPTHDAIASDSGKQLPDRMIPHFVEAYGGTYQRLNSPLEVDA